MTTSVATWITAAGLMVLASAAEAQSMFVTANTLVQQPARSVIRQTISGPSRQEMATLSAEQQFGSAGAYDLGGGLLRRLGSRWKLGIGLGFSRAQDGAIASVGLTLPHPIVFYRPSTVVTTTDEALERRETATHIPAVLETGGRSTRVRLFGGPSHIRLTQRLVSAVQVSERLDLSPDLPYAVTITNIETAEATASAWGYHLGADAGVFFSRHVGIGGLVRYSRATTRLPGVLQAPIDGTSETTREETLGGLSFGGGLRLRF